jgi:DNA-binding NarL/FixJ family response regulator
MSPLRVLIVDDVTEVRRDLRLVLSLSEAIEIAGEAANGLEAICQVESLKPAVILMDLEMPVLTGYEACSQIKSRWPECRVIALTVHDYAEARHKASLAGIDAFIVKGEPVDTLIKTILERKE